MRGSRKFYQRGPNSDNDFFDEMRKEPNSPKSGQSSAASAFKWRFAGGPM